MSAENKKIIWIAVSVCAFALVLAGVGLIAFAPKKGGAQAPASLSNSSPPKAEDPQDFLSVPPPPMASSPSSPDGDVIVVYGDKPQSLEPPPSVTADGGQGLGGVDSAGEGTEAIAKTATSIAPPQPSSAPKPAAAPKSATTSSAKAKTTAPAASAAKTASSTKAAVAKPTAKKPVDEYWIQAASFSSRGKADELREGLAKKGMAALITVKDINGKSWYRVRIGPYSTQAEADGWLGRVRGIGGCEEAGIWKSSKK